MPEETSQDEYAGESSRFRELLTQYLLPMFPGTSLGPVSRSPPSSNKLVAFENPCSIFLRPSATTLFRLPLRRSQKFAGEEKSLVSEFVKHASDAIKVANNRFTDELMASVPRRAIAGLLAPGPVKTTLRRCLQSMEGLAGRTYEGRPIVAAIGITSSVGYGQITLEQLWNDQFSFALATGLDSIFLCGSDGKVLNVKQLENAPAQPYAPIRFGAISKWCTGRRVAVTLNRQGEILVFQEGALKFARRRGAWKFYPYEAVIKRLGRGRSLSLRKAVYDSCLDVSFGRTGGCIAVLNKSGTREIRDVVKPDDFLEAGATPRTKLLAHAINRPFQNLHRGFRRELLAIDGATILDYSGRVLTAGAIVKVPSGSSSGGREAAAKELSRFGMGIKISADGPITGFRHKTEVFSL